MTSDNLSALIARLEAATGPDRELADDVLLACGWTVERRHPELLADWWSPATKRYVELNRPDPTASIDAALTLLHPQTLWAVGHMEDGPFARLVCPQHGGGYIGGYRDATAATPALALCAAALKARTTAPTGEHTTS